MFDSFEIADTVNKRKKIHCVECKRDTIHLVEVTLEGKWTSEDSHHHEYGATEHSLLRCGACDHVTYERSKWSTYDYDHDDDGNASVSVYSKQFPPPVTGQFVFNTEHAPDGLSKIFDELLYSMAGSHYILATVGLRLAVEFIVRDKQCVGRNLKDKIDDLSQRGHIDDAQKDLLHKIRLRGNRGAHQSLGMSSTELIAGLNIVDGLVEEFYNGPARRARIIEMGRLAMP